MSSALLKEFLEQCPQPPCDPADPSSIPEKAVSYMKLAPGTKLMSIELTYKDGPVSETKTFRADPRTNR